MNFDKRHRKTLSFKEVFEAFVKRQNDPLSYMKGKIVNSWKDIVGESIAKRTTKIYITEKTLVVHLDSSVLKHELHFMRQAILEKVNDMAGSEIINRIIFK